MFTGDRMFLTDLGGSIYSARLDGSEKRTIARRSRKHYRNRLRPSADLACNGPFIHIDEAAVRFELFNA